MDVCFKATESLLITVEESSVPIHHYLRQPQRLVNAIADPKLMEELSDCLFRLKMRPLNFMNLYHLQPTVILNVWSDSQGQVYLRSQDCEIRGIDYINQRFSFNLKGKLIPNHRQGKTHLEGKANLEITVALPPALWLTPKPLLELTGNSILKSVLVRIKQRLMSQLLQDYHEWCSQYSSEEKLQQNPLNSSVNSSWAS